MLETSRCRCLYLYGCGRCGLRSCRNWRNSLENKELELFILQLPALSSHRSLDLPGCHSLLVLREWELSESTLARVVSLHSVCLRSSCGIPDRSASAVLGEQAGASQNNRRAAGSSLRID